jgi:hypothetical protein
MLPPLLFSPLITAHCEAALHVHELETILRKVHKTTHGTDRRKPRVVCSKASNHVLSSSLTLLHIFSLVPRHQVLCHINSCPPLLPLSPKYIILLGLFTHTPALSRVIENFVATPAAIDYLIKHNCLYQLPFANLSST